MGVLAGEVSWIRCRLHCSINCGLIQGEFRVSEQRKLKFAVDSFETNPEGIRLIGRNCGSPLRSGDVFTIVRFLAHATRVADRQQVLEESASRATRLIVRAIRAFDREFDELPSNDGGQPDCEGSIPPDLVCGDFLYGDA